LAAIIPNDSLRILSELRQSDLPDDPAPRLFVFSIHKGIECVLRPCPPCHPRHANSRASSSGGHSMTSRQRRHCRHPGLSPTGRDLTHTGHGTDEGGGSEAPLTDRSPFEMAAQGFYAGTTQSEGRQCGVVRPPGGRMRRRNPFQCVCAFMPHSLLPSESAYNFWGRLIFACRTCGKRYL